MKILGIDPGYGITGFGLIDAQRGQYRLLGCGAITTPPNTGFFLALRGHLQRHDPAAANGAAGGGGH